MKILHPVLILVLMAFAGCDRSEEDTADATDSLTSHREAVADFQKGQRRFKELIATVRDEKSFDAALPGLEQITSDWHDVTETLRKLEPPSAIEQEQLRKVIAEGHRATEPTGEDMLSLFSMESREEEILQWFEEFATAGGEVGAEMARLYGKTDYARSEIKTSKFDSGKVKSIDLANDHPLMNLNRVAGTDQEGEQGYTNQPATASEPKPEDTKNAKPE